MANGMLEQDTTPYEIGVTQEPDPNDPLVILSNSLTQSRIDLTEEASIRAVDSIKQVSQNETYINAFNFNSNKAEVDRKVQMSTEALFENLSDRQFQGIVPPGSRVLVKSPNIKETVHPDGSISIDIVAKGPTAPSQTQNLRPEDFYRTSQQAAAKTFDKPFDLEAAIKAIDTIQDLGEKGAAIRNINAHIDSEVNKLRTGISERSAMESGYVNAKAAYDRAVQQEHVPNPRFGGLSFAQRFNGQPSMQTVQAQAFMNQTKMLSDSLELTYLKKDPELGKLGTSKEWVKSQELAHLTMQQKRLEAKLTREEKKKEEEEFLVKSTPTHIIANFKALYDKTGTMTNAEAADQYHKRKGKGDIGMELAVQFNPQTATTLLTDPRAEVRNNALILLTHSDKANNTAYGEAKTTPVTNLVKKYVDNPDLLIDDALTQNVINVDKVKDIKRRLKDASATEREKIMREEFPMLLTSVVEKVYYEDNLLNFSNWKSSESVRDTPLGKTIAEIEKFSVRKNAEGKIIPTAPMNLVVNKFMTDTSIKNPDGSVMTSQQRLDILNSGLTSAVANEFKSALYPQTGTLELNLKNGIGIVATRAWARSKVSNIEVPPVGAQEGFAGYGMGPGTVRAKIPRVIRERQEREGTKIPEPALEATEPTVGPTPPQSGAGGYTGPGITHTTGVRG